MRRSHLFEDAFRALARVPEQQLKNRLQVQFEDEAGIDGGGLLKEFLDELAKRMPVSLLTHRLPLPSYPLPLSG